MNAGRRLAYLEALGVDVWVRRDGVNPAVGPDIGAEAPRPQGPQPVSQALVGGASPDRIAADVPAPGWEDLALRVKDCPLCTELVANRTQTVFGVGDRDADWLFVGEAPGADEDRQGEPFVGRAGKLLDAMLHALGLARGEGVYIANILKCRPPGNRDPKPEEAQNCRPYLDRQIGLIRPKIIVALGRIAAQNLLATDTPIGKLRGRAWEYQGIPLVVTYHPAYLLRSPTEKRRTWEDLLLARRLMGEQR